MPPYVVEIASNDGTFLKRFIENGCKVLGVDPAKNIAELAINNGVPTNANFFTVELAKQLLNKDGEVDDLIEFAFDLDYEKYMKHYEVR